MENLNDDILVPMIEKYFSVDTKSIKNYHLPNKTITKLESLSDCYNRPMNLIVHVAICYLYDYLTTFTIPVESKENDS